MGNANIKQQSSNILGDGKFGGQVTADGVVGSTGTFNQISVKTADVSGAGTFGTIAGQSANIAGAGTFGTIAGQSANIAGAGVFGNITGNTLDISGTGSFGTISSDNSNFGNISGTSLALQRGNITWGFNITDKDDLCITQNGTNLTCISQQGILY